MVVVRHQTFSHERVDDLVDRALHTGCSIKMVSDRNGMFHCQDVVKFIRALKSEKMGCEIIDLLRMQKNSQNISRTQHDCLCDHPTFELVILVLDERRCKRDGTKVSFGLMWGERSVLSQYYPQFLAGE